MLRASSQTSNNSASAAQAAGAYLFEPLNVEALKQIIADLRPQDAEEIVSTLPRHIAFIDIPQRLVMGSVLGAVFRHKGLPAAAIGVVENWAGVWEGWSWGTEHYAACHGAMAEWCRTVIMPAVIDQKVHRIHVKALLKHGDAHRWISWLGLQREADHPGYGRYGQTFVTFAWTSPHLRGRDD